MSHGRHLYAAVHPHLIARSACFIAELSLIWLVTVSSLLIPRFKWFPFYERHIHIVYLQLDGIIKADVFANTLGQW